MAGHLTTALCEEKLREAEARLAEEKQTRLSEAEDKLKQAREGGPREGLVR